MDIGYVFIGFVIVSAIVFFMVKSKYAPPRPSAPKGIKKDMNYEELKHFTGEERENVLVALKGIIYDVSASDFYRKGAAYAVFAGHDASINLALMSHDEKYLNKWGSFTLDEKQTEILNDWESKFRDKYPVVGIVI